MRVGLILGIVGLPVACTTVPEKQFQDYAAAFSDMKAVTEELLLDLDAAKKDEANRMARPAPPVSPVIPQNLDSRKNPGICSLLHQVFHPGKACTEICRRNVYAYACA